MPPQQRRQSANEAGSNNQPEAGGHDVQPEVAEPQIAASTTRAFRRTSNTAAGALAKKQDPISARAVHIHVGAGDSSTGWSDLVVVAADRPPDEADARKQRWTKVCARARTHTRNCARAAPDRARRSSVCAQGGRESHFMSVPPARAPHGSVPDEARRHSKGRWFRCTCRTPRARPLLPPPRAAHQTAAATAAPDPPPPPPRQSKALLKRTLRRVAIVLAAAGIVAASVLLPISQSLKADAPQQLVEVRMGVFSRVGAARVAHGARFLAQGHMADRGTRPPQQLEFPPPQAAAGEPTGVTRQELHPPCPHAPWPETIGPCAPTRTPPAAARAGAHAGAVPAPPRRLVQPRVRAARRRGVAAAARAARLGAARAPRARHGRRSDPGPGLRGGAGPGAGGAVKRHGWAPRAAGAHLLSPSPAARPRVQPRKELAAALAPTAPLACRRPHTVRPPTSFHSPPNFSP